MIVHAAASHAEPLATAEVQYREVDVTYAAEAVVEATRQSTVSAQTTGRIVELRYDVGDVVQKGQVIARIDQTELAQVVAGSEAQVAQAKAAYENTRVEAERTRDLARQKFVSQAALDRAEAALRIADAQLKAAKAGAGQATTSRGYTTIIAPYTGVVSARHVELGEMAAPGKPLLTGFDPADLRVVATVPQYKIGEVRTSPRASVEIPSIGRMVPGASITVLPAADARSHSTLVRIDLPHDVRGITPGVYARAHFTVGRGGMPMAYEMREKARAEDQITVVSNAPKFHFVPSNPWVAVNWRKRDDIELDIEPLLEKRNIEFIVHRREARASGRQRAGTRTMAALDYDFLIIATGPKLAFDEVEGLGPKGHTQSVCHVDHAMQSGKASGSGSSRIPARSSSARCRARPATARPTSSPSSWTPI
jgi:RND family efflux transporter MFP subunit